MKKIFVVVAIIIAMVVGVVGGFAIAQNMPQSAAVESKTHTERVDKEITEIDASIEFNMVTVKFDDGDYFQSNWDNFFFTETSQGECMFKEYDENNNLVSVHVIYNPDTTKYN